MKPLRERLKHIDVYFDASESDANELYEIAKQMDALLEECVDVLGKCMNLHLHEEGEIGQKLRKAGYTGKSIAEHITELKAPRWQPIETAPDSDGTYQITGDYSALVSDGDYVLIATRRMLGTQHFWQFTDCDGHSRIKLTHWMPLPPPPETNKPNSKE